MQESARIPSILPPAAGFPLIKLALLE